jgi:serine/threonine protein phosphatase PrpC
MEEGVMQNSLSLALLTLGGWLLLCLLLVVPLVVAPLLRRRKAQEQAGANAMPRAARAPGKAGVLFSMQPEAQPALSPAWSLPDAVTIQQVPMLAAPPGMPVLAPAEPKQAERREMNPPRPFGVQMHAGSARGRVHEDEENEDGFLVVTGTRSKAGKNSPFGLCVVADGVSGYATGHEASRQAMLAISQRFVPLLTQRDLSEGDLGMLLAASIQSANYALFQHNQRSDHPMGCTVTAALITDAEITICHVGKNRGYFLPDQPPLRRLTVDHSIVESLVVAGLIQRDDVYTHPKRNRIFRCLGQGAHVEVDTIHVPAATGDRLLFCSDGLWEVLRDPALEETLRAYGDGAQANNQLLALAQERGGMDDITSILVDLTDDFKPAKRPGISRVSSNQMDLEM